MNIRGRAVLVTGATGGLGREFVRQFLARGAHRVYAAARRDHDWHDEHVVPIHLDVTDPESIRAAAGAATDVEVVVNNAGITGAPSLLTSPIEEIRATFETNVFGPLELVRAVAPTLARRGGGAVIDVHSVLSWLAAPGAYSPSKAAFWGLTNALRLELAGQGTQVVGAHLAYTDTPMIAHLDVPKSDPAVVVSRILDALEDGADEALADEVTSGFRAVLSTATTGRVPSRA
ncbi:SDR family oxidoreductase [Rhodococcus sp. O3]|uniref:SDR family oxidoreductase n=1 Tax=Rhodococcus sp. O3 TaxID=3404919 RepID=UPI003B679DA5